MGFCGGKYKLLSVLSMIIFCSFCFSYLKPVDTYSTASTLTLSVIDKLSLNVSSVNSDGVFASSDTDTNNISVTTNNGTGYLLGIKASTEGGNALVNATDSSKTVPSHTISAGVSKTNYNDASYASANNLNNTWGFRPSTYYDTTNNVTINNTTSNLYFPGPSSTTNQFIIDKTTAANATANEYNIALGTRVNSNTTPGQYINTFIVTAVANPTIYSIAYNKNTQDAVTNLPTNVINQSTYGDSVNISNLVPVRDGYNFKGWCTVQVADGGTCTGTTYNPDGGGTALTWTLDQTVSSNSLIVYAMWGKPACNPSGTTISTIVCMQDISSSNRSSILGSMTQGSQYRLYDNRDYQQYWIAKQADGKIWMTQNLDLDIGGTGVAALTSENTDLNTSGSAPYIDGYSTSGGIITWAPLNSAKTAGRTISGTNVTGWSNDDITPYSAEGGDRYYYNTGTTSNETAQTLSECKSSGHTEGDCAHYHAGNYYNWTAAIASNASSGIGSTNYAVAANSICPKGWKLPQGRASSVGDAATMHFGNLWYTSGATNSVDVSAGISGFTTNGFNIIRSSPLFFARAGYVIVSNNRGKLNYHGNFGYWWSSSIKSSLYAYHAEFNNPNISSGTPGLRYVGYPVRCIVR